MNYPPLPSDIYSLSQDLDHWFSHNARPLPWRERGISPWAILLSEVMSQQTPVSRVIPLWEAWLQRWPTPTDLATASTKDILKLWANLGYPRRALRLKDCALSIVNNHRGEVPASLPDLLALPGIGSYTARAVMAFAFHIPVPVVDTNVRRVLYRVLHGEFHQGSARKQDLSDISSLMLYVEEEGYEGAISFHEEIPGIPEASEEKIRCLSVTQCSAFMELGALVCTAQNPQCEQCPIKNYCLWYQSGQLIPAEETENLSLSLEMPGSLHGGKASPRSNRAGKRVRKTQKYEGTDRQARGKILKYLRENDYIHHNEVLQINEDSEQMERAIQSLLEDKLVTEYRPQFYSLPE